jgi:hypothetical protein
MYGMKLPANAIFICDEQHAVLEHWEAIDARSLRVLHIDEHCDMRGLLVDRKRQVAGPVPNDPLLACGTVYGGNFLTYAVLGKRIDAVRWVYGRLGGRRYDVETVKYLTDVTALPHRIAAALGKWHAAPLAYEERDETNFDGLREGEVLDIDWDYIASTSYLPGEIEGRASALLSAIGQARPSLVYVTYSPRYSHPSRDAFDRFVHELATRYALPIAPLPSPQRPRMPRFLLPRSVRTHGKRLLRRLHVY